MSPVRPCTIICTKYMRIRCRSVARGAAILHHVYKIITATFTVTLALRVCCCRHRNTRVCVCVPQSCAKTKSFTIKISFLHTHTHTHLAIDRCRTQTTGEILPFDVCAHTKKTYTQYPPNHTAPFQYGQNGGHHICVLFSHRDVQNMYISPKERTPPKQSRARFARMRTQF